MKPDTRTKDLSRCLPVATYRTETMQMAISWLTKFRSRRLASYVTPLRQEMFAMNSRIRRIRSSWARPIRATLCLTRRRLPILLPTHGKWTRTHSRAIIEVHGNQNAKVKRYEIQSCNFDSGWRSLAVSRDHVSALLPRVRFA